MKRKLRTRRQLAQIDEPVINDPLDNEDHILHIPEYSPEFIQDNAVAIAKAILMEAWRTRKQG
jgi:hypothetical protein